MFTIILAAVVANFVWGALKYSSSAARFGLTAGSFFAAMYIVPAFAGAVADILPS